MRSRGFATALVAVLVGLSACASLKNGSELEPGDAGDASANGRDPRDGAVDPLADGGVDGRASRDAALEPSDAQTVDSGPTIRRVFVTSDRFTGALAMAADTTATQIVARIDAKCQSAANAETLGGTWKAWISASDGSTTVHAIDHVGQRGPFYRLDGKIAFVRLYDSGNLAPLADRLLTEKRTLLVEGDYDAARVWTGTGLAGRVTGSTCQAGGRSWRYSASDGIGTSGHPLDQGITGEWTISGSGACDTQRRLYCFED